MLVYKLAISAVTKMVSSSVVLGSLFRKSHVSRSLWGIFLRKGRRRVSMRADKGPVGHRLVDTMGRNVRSWGEGHVIVSECCWRTALEIALLLWILGRP